ncbi:MAG TPA: SDR family NAD(P)-dependent oxidoreductase [Baekduia sp.]|nr:SDR family NAD(P)-dependent oxidoreductase [Baekduia sp.]
MKLFLNAAPAPPGTRPARTAYMTGASSGIGRALALELAARGADLFLAARRADALEEVRARIATEHPARRVVTSVLDVTDLDAARANVAEAAAALGRLDLIIANAGTDAAGRIGDGHWADHLKVMTTNYLGATATLDAGVEVLRRQGGGQIVGIGSVATFGEPGGAPYCSSKAGLEVYLQSLRTETWREPIAVTTISPGYIDTPINQAMASRPFLIDATEGARVIADRIERGGGRAALPKWPWPYVSFMMRHLPERVLLWAAER